MDRPLTVRYSRCFLLSRNKHAALPPPPPPPAPKMTGQSSTPESGAKWIPFRCGPQKRYPKASAGGKRKKPRRERRNPKHAAAAAAAAVVDPYYLGAIAQYSRAGQGRIGQAARAKHSIRRRMEKMQDTRRKGEIEFLQLKVVVAVAVVVVIVVVGTAIVFFLDTY